MIEYVDESTKPFKVGQLVKTNYQGNPELLLVLGIQWKCDFDDWYLRLVSQRTGRIIEDWHVNYDPVEENDEYK
jgi:hypothetical protein